MGSDNQARDDRGRWASEGTSGGGEAAQSNLNSFLSTGAEGPMASDRKGGKGKKKKEMSAQDKMERKAAREKFGKEYMEKMDAGMNHTEIMDSMGMGDKTDGGRRAPPSAAQEAGSSSGESAGHNWSNYARENSSMLPGWGLESEGLTEAQSMRKYGKRNSGRNNSRY